MKQHDGFIKNSDVSVLLAGGGHKPLSDFLNASNFKTVNGQSLIGTGDISISSSAAWANISGKPFNWSGQSGQPTWLWGSNDGSNYYVWNPSNFNVNYANSAGSVAWGNVTGKPSTFTPSAHDHGPLLYINGSSSDNPRICWHIPNTNWGNISLLTNGEFYFRTGNSTSGGFAGLNMGTIWVNGDISIDAGRRIYPEGGALYIGNANNASWVGIQDCCSQASLGDGYWSLRTNGTAHFVATYNSSDIRQKRDLQFVSNNIVNAYFNTEYGYLTEFTWKRDGKRSFGTIAQWIENFCPESIDEKSDGYFSVNYNVFLSKVCACNFVKIKEIISSNLDLYVKIQGLEKRILDLELENQDLKERLNN